MGVPDAVAYCQGVVEAIFGDLLGHCMVAWLDDILGFAETKEALLDVLDQVLARCEQYGLKLHAKKCTFFSTNVKWGGRIISADGVTHCPERVQGLVEMQRPRTAGELQQFVCAANWMRQSLPEYPRISAALYEAVDRAAQVVGSPYAIVEATRRLEYLLLRPRGFRLYTDHRNLVYIFNPYATDGTMARYQADKLQRWALSLMSFQYHVPGDVNVWGDLLSRWGAGQVREDEHEATRVARLAVVERVSPLEDPEFVWPSETEIKAVQDAARKAAQGLEGAQ
ncbi:unnamed protein product [Phytophthora fragariaefolia]|uniref:Unnamed protein product n=1 Tax=Phytophthora fragariaefolia TaxID=1490495 RepID=A0A9W6XJY3_9STRA|nr:unnamed protein product [Phytophthora fragariaefolia]